MIDWYLEYKVYLKHDIQMYVIYPIQVADRSPYISLITLKYYLN